MYAEFIAIYVGMGVMLVLQIVVFVLVILLLKKVGNMQNKRNRIVSSASNQEKQRATIVFCTNCATEFDSEDRFCPKCGAARQ